MSQQITLKVSDKSFVTTKSTLINGVQGGSQYFAHLFSANNEQALQALTISKEQHHHDPSKAAHNTSEHSDGPTYFLDLDPRTFHYILDYLRSGVMPFLWNEDKGFDYIAYAKLERMATHLQIPRLLDWLRRKMYLQAVQQVFTADVHTMGKGLGQKPNTQFNGGPEKVSYSVTRSGDWGAAVVVVKKWTNIDNRVLFDER